jgi:hypothetical protein
MNSTPSSLTAAFSINEVKIDRIGPSMKGTNLLSVKKSGLEARLD